MPGSWSSAKQMVTTFYASVEKTPDEGDIVQMLKQAAKMQGLSLNGKEFEQAFRELRSQLLDKVPEGTTLTDNEKTVWEEWLPEMKASELSFPRWLAYYQYLQKKQGADYIQLQTLGRSTERILGLLADPRRDHPPVQRKGLVLGDVQSGKTRTYMALMNKAVDCGYKLIVVLTSSDESLRGQTQKRINSDFIGFDFARKVTGIGEYLGKEAVTVTPLTNDDDFIKAQSSAFKTHPRPTWDRAPLVAVMKKNGQVLDKFNKWLDNPEFPKDLPVLVIDDESDYASVNSAKAEDSPTRINSLICKLCRISKRTSYVAVTATPFANVFIDDELEDDLFPKDFIHILPTPAAYIGAKKLFGDLDTPATDSSCIHELEWGRKRDLDKWLPLTHKKEYKFTTNKLDPQIEYAVDCFLIACALRANSERKRQSMLLHLSRFTAVQQQIADMVNDYLDNMTNVLQYHLQNEADERIIALRRAYKSEYAGYASTHGITWNILCRRMQSLAGSGRLLVRLVNSDAKDWNLARSVPSKLTPNECTIYVGGNQISRGMTLDGLVCSVFYRNVTSADTLLQMGRWFGYRPGYDALQRIWLLRRSIDDFRYACFIVEDIKDTANKMSEYGMTPQQLGISIQGNPSRGVRITSANKMRNATKTNGPLETFDLANQIIESVRLDVDPERNETNNKALDILITDCISNEHITASRPEQGTTKIFQNVPSKTIIDFLSAYRAGYNDTYFGPTLMRYKNREPLESNTTMMAQFARTRQSNIPGTTWTIAFINGEGAIVSGNVPFTWKEVVRTSDFYDDDHMYWKISGDKLRLAGSTDYRKVADILHPKNVYPGNKSEREYYLTKYFGDDPVLMLYRVHVKTRHPDSQAEKHIPSEGHGLLGAKIIIPTVDYIDRGKRRTSVTYYSNTVATRLTYESLERQEEENDEQ